MISFSLPWPSAKLNPNRCKGLHWAATSKLRKDARDFAQRQARYTVSQYTLPDSYKAGEIPLTIVFIQPDRRARDRDNLLAALKPSLDGVADAMGVNDSQFEPVTIRREYGAKPGSVRIEIGGSHG